MKSALCISLDLELLWGWHDLRRSVFERKREEMVGIRERVHSLVELLERWDAPCTWATVAHLFMPACQGHPDYPVEAWLDKDPRSRLQEEPLWYAPDLIERLRSSPVGFEIGCHSFSHADFQTIDERQARFEIEVSKNLAQELGIGLKSFVFPRNRVGHLELLAEAGFSSYRPAAQPDNRPAAAKAAGLLLATDTPRPVTPYVDDNGLVAIPPSLNLGRFHSWAKRALYKAPPRNFLINGYRRALDEITRDGGVLHVWFHPSEWELTVDSSEFEYLLRLAKRYEDKGELEILTMEQIADRSLTTAETVLESAGQESR